MPYDRIASILSTLVAFDTTSCNSNLEIIDWIEEFLTPLGFSLQRVCDESGEKANLWATIGPHDQPAMSFRPYGCRAGRRSELVE